MFPEVDPVLGPEMRSTGEVLGMAPSFGLAYFKAQEAAQPPLPLEGTVFISVTDKDKPAILEVAQKFQTLGFRIKATNGTCNFLKQHGVKAELSYKIHEHQRPNIVDEIKSKEIQLIINTPIGKIQPVRRRLHPQGRHQVQGALPHHHRRREGLGRGHRGIPQRPRRGEIAPGIPPGNQMMGFFLCRDAGCIPE